MHTCPAAGQSCGHFKHWRSLHHGYPLPLGARVILTVAWPTLLHGTVPLKLILYGTVVRANASDAAATIERYAFEVGALLRAGGDYWFQGAECTGTSN